MQSPRHMSGYQVVPLVWETFADTAAQSPVRVWEPLHTIARSPAAATRHFATVQTAIDKALLADEFSSYVRQAHDYFQGGSQVPGTSAALLYYYSVLQLAKAELLALDPASILGVRIGHGLSHQVGNAGNPESDFLTVTSGVFPALYEKRTGVAISQGTTLHVRDLVQYVPELEFQLKDVLGMNQIVIPLCHAIATNRSDLWTLLLAEVPKNYPQRYMAEFEAAVGAAFDEIPLHVEWKKIFAVSERAFVNPLPRLFQSKNTFPDGTVVEDVAWSNTAAFKHSLDNPFEERADATYWPTLGGLPMTPSLARYSLMYYLSSVVRYKPSILSHNRYPDYAWVLEAFVNASPINLVTNACDGIRGKWGGYGYRFRT